MDNLIKWGWIVTGCLALALILVTTGGQIAIWEGRQDLDYAVEAYKKLETITSNCLETLDTIVEFSDETLNAKEIE